jgi:hypothetical protein
MHEMQTKGGQQPFPLMVLGSKRDYLFGEKALKTTAKHYLTEAIILNEGCHDLMLDPNWLQSAEYIGSWLEYSYSEVNKNDTAGAKNRMLKTVSNTKVELLV